MGTHRIDKLRFEAPRILLGEKALASGVTGSLRLPVDGSYTDDGSSLKITDLQPNIAAFQLAVYDGRGSRD